MQPQQIEKLKGLIKISPILNEQERSEWLMLLELMDDKQANELEKILNSNQPASSQPAAQKDQRPTLGFSPVPKTAPAPLLVEKDKGKPAPAGLSFSHIVNFPKVPKDQQPVKTAPPSGGLIQPKSGFFQKLKDVLAEKELPPGHPNPVQELELAAPGSEIGGRKSAVGEQINKIDKSNTANQPYQPNKILSPLAARPPIIPKPASKGIEPKPLSHVQPQPAKPPLGQREQGSSAGLHFLDKARAEAPVSARPNISPEPVSPAKPGAGSNSLKDLKDAAALDANFFNPAGINMLVPKLKALIKAYGYHDLIFNLEKSPLYKAYIDTGAKLLMQQSTFEDLPGGRQAGYLTREEFEKFTDVLRQIQA